MRLLLPGYYGYPPQIINKDESVLNAVNNHLKEIEGDLNFIDFTLNKHNYDEQQIQSAVEKKKHLSEQIANNINTLRLMVGKTAGSRDALALEYQVLYIQYGMLTFRCGDLDWQSFLSSLDMYLEIDRFLNSARLTLDLGDRSKYNITDENWEYAWDCCKYNFAYHILYYALEMEGVELPEPYKHFFPSEIKNDVATAIANVQVARRLCEESFERSDYNKQPEDIKKLLANLIRLEAFYDNYLQCNDVATWKQLRQIAEGLVQEKMYLPAEVRNDLAI